MKLNFGPFVRLTPTGRVLRDARRMIQRKGWAQGRAGGASGPGPCAAWAICKSSWKGKGKGPSSEQVLAAFANHNDLPYPRPDYNPTQRTTVWNDTLGRTKVEVIEAFLAAEAAETESLLRL